MPPQARNVDPLAGQYFRDELRRARADALGDAEAFDAVIVVIERLGSYLSMSSNGLAAYKPALAELVKDSPLVAAIEESDDSYHTPFGTLFELVREGRNVAVHEGALARHLTTHAIELSLMLEDALMADCRKAADYMIRSPIVAHPWQPLSFIRQSMLVNSFSYLPVQVNQANAWWLVSDRELARYLRQAASQSELKQRLRTTLRDAVSTGGLSLTRAKILPPDALIPQILDGDSDAPALVTDPGSGALLGLLAAFDLL